VKAEVVGFARFVEVHQRALQRTAWLLTGDWAPGRGPCADHADPLLAALGADYAAGRPGDLCAPGHAQEARAVRVGRMRRTCVIQEP
jgi:hypothetical protein